MKLPEDAFFRTHSALVFAGADVSVYELRVPPSEREPRTDVR